MIGGVGGSSCNMADANEDVVPYNAAITKSTWTLAGGMFKVGLEGFKGILMVLVVVGGGVYAGQKLVFF